MPRPGQRVGRYELIRMLGQGGMGQVWLARGEVIAGAKRTVALKFFPYDAEGELDTFMSEARVAMLLTHSNIVQVFDAGESEHGRYLVMEWVDGIDLLGIWKGERKHDRAIELETIVFILAQVLRGLHYAHGLKQHGQPLRIVHRDVSPQNVIVSVSGEVKLADFGIARSALHSTAGTHIKGKLRYMPPEQLEGLPLSVVAALYAVGVMFHELVSNAPYRRGRSVEELCKEITMGGIPDLEPSLPDELEAMRRRFLAREPEERFASAAEALRAFEDWPAFRDRTFRVAELCERHAKRDAAEEIDEGERAATQPAAARARVSTEPARIDPIVREPARSRWPIAAVGGLLISAAAVMAAWRPWERDPPAPSEPAVSASAPKVREEPVVQPPVAAPEVERAPIELTKEETIEPTPPVEPTPAPEAKRDRKPKQRRTNDSGPPPDAKVIASLRSAARSGCRAREGQTSIEIEFLIEADGRPALPRSSAPGDARSKCIEQKLRNARFAPGPGRRGSVTVTFDP